MGLDFLTQWSEARDAAMALHGASASADVAEAEKALQELASVFLQQPPLFGVSDADRAPSAEAPSLNMEAKYRALVEQIPAVVRITSGRPLRICCHLDESAFRRTDSTGRPN